MRLLLINNLFGDEARGGAETVVETEARALMAGGHQVAVLCGGAADRRFDWHGLAVISVRPPKTYPYGELASHGWLSRLFWHSRHLFSRAWAAKTMAAVRDFAPDVVHSHNLMGLGFRLPPLIRQAGIRHLHTLHDIQLLHPSGCLPAGKCARLLGPAWLYAKLTKWLFGSPEFVLSPSQFLLDEYRRHGLFLGSSAAVLPNPVSGRGEKHDAPARPRFLFVGQLSEHKGIKLLLRAWDGWLAAGRADLEIVGDGPLADWVRPQADRLENVTWSGRVTGEGLAAAYRRATYLVMSSLVLENSPATISEAFSHGVPAVAAVTGGVEEMVREGETGFLFVPGDDCALRGAMNRALAAWQSGQWSEMSERCRLRVAGQTTDYYVQRLMRLLKTR
jgi:glycosyltransferase involved in cell wall biosynthesis